MNQKTALRIAVALERIADRLDLVILEPAPSQEPPTDPTCRHPKDQRLALGQTNGWICQVCQFQQPPRRSGRATTIRDRLLSTL